MKAKAKALANTRSAEVDLGAVTEGSGEGSGEASGGPAPPEAGTAGTGTQELQVHSLLK